MKLGRFLAKKLNSNFPSHFFGFPDHSENNSKIVIYREPPGKLNTLHMQMRGMLRFHYMFLSNDDVWHATVTQ
jgi:hypothetical protein